MNIRLATLLASIQVAPCGVLWSATGLPGMVRIEMVE